MTVMERTTFSLCPACGACPEVEILGDEVLIGEAGNLAVLKKEEWNALVELIRSGQLSRLYGGVRGGRAVGGLPLARRPPCPFAVSAQQCPRSYAKSEIGKEEFDEKMRT